MLENLEQTYKEMVETQNFSKASHIAFKIAELMTKEESGWCGCTKSECQEWMELGYINAIKSKNAH